MPKRTADDAGFRDAQEGKRQRPAVMDRLSELSDELTLRILSHLSIAELGKCQRLSRKFYGLAGDSQLWKSHYYDRFVRPRARRLPGLRDTPSAAPKNDKGSFYFASKASRWLDEEHLVLRGGETNWKRQYKLRHNWTRGCAAVNEIQVAEQAPVPPVVVQMCEGVVYVADQEEGLRAWRAKGRGEMVARTTFGGSEEGVGRVPTSMAVDTSGEEVEGVRRVVVGFEDGSFRVWTLDIGRGQFVHEYSHAPSTNGVVASVAVVWPYVLTMTATQLLSLYAWPSPPNPPTVPTADPTAETPLPAPRLQHSLKSHTVYPPLTTSLRLSPTTTTISIAYSLPTYLSGWTVGVQELSLSRTGVLLHSRTTSAIESHYRPLAFASPPMVSHLSFPATSSHSHSQRDGGGRREFEQIHTKPTSLSYTHPYLLVSHPDNTLTLYLVSSTHDGLSISSGSRLWGHTSSVSGAHVGQRGKAVSVSKRGDELRVWELEGGFGSMSARKRLAGGEVSVRVRPEGRGRGPGALGSEAQRSKSLEGDGEVQQAGLDLVNHGAEGDEKVDGEEVDELTLTRGWIGFDEENVVVLKERCQGRQALVVYDFT